MFDTMTFTKILGGVCGTFLLFLFANWGAESLYHVGPSGHGDEHAQAYIIDTGDADGHDEPKEEAVPFADLLAIADAGKGASVFKKCAGCHKVDGGKGTGPYLNGIVGRDIAAIDGYGYSGTLAAVEGDWTPEQLDAFLTSPKAFASDTKMSFKGLNKPQDRANLVAYLQSLGG